MGAWGPGLGFGFGSWLIPFALLFTFLVLPVNVFIHQILFRLCSAFSYYVTKKKEEEEEKIALGRGSITGAGRRPG